METNMGFMEPLLEKAAAYGKTSFELLKLRSLDKTAAITSSLISRFILAIVLSIFVLTLNIALALWLGDLMGKSYYGFLVVAAFYGLAAIVLLFLHPHIKARINDAVVSQLFN